jgi:hypothetical protein
MNPTFKDEVRAAWVARIQNSLTVPPPPSEAMQRWVELQWALAKYSASFHGGLHTAYSTGPAAFAAVIGALENGFQAAAGPYQRRPLFHGLRQ